MQLSFFPKGEGITQPHPIENWTFQDQTCYAPAPPPRSAALTTAPYCLWPSIPSFFPKGDGITQPHPIENWTFQDQTCYAPAPPPRSAALTMFPSCLWPSIPSFFPKGEGITQPHPIENWTFQDQTCYAPAPLQDDAPPFTTSVPYCGQPSSSLNKIAFTKS
jgi:hypothetical protein